MNAAGMLHMMTHPAPAPRHDGLRFYLGTHQPAWAYRPEFAGVPLFVSARRLRGQKTWRRFRAPWALDSGGFTELSLHGKWTVTPWEYVRDVRRWAQQCGAPEFAAPQDWMCEPVMLARTGKTVAEHQELTVTNYLDLRRLGPELPFAPVLQGWEYGDYLRHVEMYEAVGVRLAGKPVVGVGSVCRRQDTGMVEELMRELSGRGIRCHGFGFKMNGLARAARWMASADSMAWSLQARRAAPLPGCTHRTCANCPRYALAWRERALAAVRRGRQATTGSLFEG